MTAQGPASRRGLFLDLDGTLADTLAALRTVYHRFLARFGVAGSEAEFQSLNGPPVLRIVAVLKATHHLPGTPDELAAAYRALAEAACATAPPHDGAGELLEAAAARGRVAAVVTSSARAATSAWLIRTGLAARVAVIVGGDDVVPPKPDPAPYRLALARTGCEAASSFAIEDGVQGATAAIGAGLPTWQIGTAPAPELVGQKLFRGTLPDLRAALALL